MIDERIHTLDVAHDLIELGRVAEALALLDSELPDRLSAPCAACGVYENRKCQVSALVTCRLCDGAGKRASYDIRYSPATRPIVHCNECYGSGTREQLADCEIPHASRVLGIARRW